MNRLTETDFFGLIVWIGGTDKERKERLHAYEDTGLEPDEIVKALRDNDAYRLAGIRYEEEISRLKDEVRRMREEEYD